VQNDDEAVRELRNEIHSLVDELNALSMRNDELMAEREQDAEGMNDMEAKVQEYKRKFDAVRIELRNLKGQFCCASVAEMG
jgi:archaellum component FlaC